MHAIPEQFVTALNENLTLLDQAVDAYLNEAPDLFQTYLFRPVWDERKEDYMVETFAKTAWVKVCLKNLQDPAQKNMHAEFSQKLKQTIPILLKNIDLFRRAPSVNQAFLETFDQLTRQLNELAQKI